MSTGWAKLMPFDRFFVFDPQNAENRASALDKKGVGLV